MKKQELRILFKQKRKALSVADIQKFNDLILINFQKLSLPDLACVHTYIASLKLGEPETATIIRYLEFKNPLIKIVIPKIDIHSGKMVHYHFHEGMEMIKNSFGIEEPKEGNRIDEKDVDLVLIPLLAFDKKGNRVGFGKGYYDKFLAQCRPSVLKVGLSFFDPVDQIEDILSVDIPLDFCVTPKQLYIF
jgi:5-formyltetrahydrofolate cyclo-ligase